MTTTAQTVLDAATKLLATFDVGTTDLANDTAELLGVLNRRIGRLYLQGGLGRRGDRLGVSAAVTLAASPGVALPTAAGGVYALSDADGNIVTHVPRSDVLRGEAELPPAVMVENQKVVTIGRSGDPLVGAVLTVRYVPIPATMTAGTDYLGATTLADPTTTQWPDVPGTEWLIAELAYYLAVKSTEVDPATMAELKAQRGETARALAEALGLDFGPLVASYEE